MIPSRNTGRATNMEKVNITYTCSYGFYSTAVTFYNCKWTRKLINRCKLNAMIGFSLYFVIFKHL